MARIHGGEDGRFAGPAYSRSTGTGPKAGAANQSFMRLAGTVHGPKDLSQRKGFSRG